MKDESAPASYTQGECTQVANNAIIGAGTELGSFVIIERDVVIGADCRIGHHCTIKAGSVLGDRVVFDDYADTSGAVVIGNEVNVKRRATVTQGTIVEDCAFIGPGAMIIHEKHVSWMRNVKKVSCGVYICAGAVIGGSATLLAGITVGPDACVAAGAVATRDCDPRVVYAGVPAQRAMDMPDKYRLNLELPEPLEFSRDVLKRYLPDLVRVGRYRV
jgi:acetyltransferase-like isoleucine patch superfamily enzyme